MKIAYVEWIDAATVDGYLNEVSDLEPLRCISCAQVHDETDKYIILCRDWFSNGTKRSGITIPKRFITKLKVFSEDDVKKAKKKTGKKC